MTSNVLSSRKSEQREVARPRVHILAPGGTIAGQAGSEVEPGYTSGEVGVEKLIAVPGVRALATFFRY